MKIHHEGYRIIIYISVSLILINTLLNFCCEISSWVQIIIGINSLLFCGFIIYFFRSPMRNISTSNKNIISPADGKLVIVKKVKELEYFNDIRLQVSIFMSPLNVHINRNPVSGVVKYIKYHKGKYLVAWHPKSSELNERSTLVIKQDDGVEILVRQIAGAVARRIVTYPNIGDKVTQGEEFGFIKFGSRVDIFLPEDTKVDLEHGAKLLGGISVISNS